MSPIETSHAHRTGRPTRAHRHIPPGYSAVRMPRALRRGTYGLFAALWATGCWWLVLHFLYPRQTDFGPAPNPWEPTILRLHGWLAVGAVFLLGWISAQHIGERWGSPRNRVSGLSLVALAGILVVSGYALYYTTDRVHDIAGFMHEFLGAGAVLIALTHWFRFTLRSVPGAHK